MAAVNIETFGLQIFFCLDLDRNDSLFGLEEEIDFSTAVFTGPVSRLEIALGPQQLLDILFGQGSFEFLKDGVSFQQSLGIQISFGGKQADIKHIGFESIGLVC